jgi:Tfp pilus assembly protein FimT
MGRRPSNARKGITLLELTVVIIILSAMMLVSIPNMRGIHERNKMITATRQIVGLLRYARAEAITSEHETEIRIDMEKGKYRLDLNKYKYYQIRGSGDILAKKTEQIEQIRDLPSFLYFKKVVTEADPYGRDKIMKIVFFPDGSATWATIILENRPKRKEDKVRAITIEVPHATGLPCVLKPNQVKTGQNTREQKEEEKRRMDSETLDQIFKEENS